MFLIHEARFLAPDVKLFRIEAPRIARRRQAGQFVIVRVHDHGERIPLTIADSDPTDGTITIIVQGVGKTTQMLNALGDRRLNPGCGRSIGGTVGHPIVWHRRCHWWRCRHGDRLPNGRCHETSGQPCH